ncbi:MAG: dienelactone hydrolase family protein [Sphingobacteriia bacterium]|nr:dienelactone hydrolase family protein [Sphingobacteriia bacterium]
MVIAYASDIIGEINKDIYMKWRRRYFSIILLGLSLSTLYGLEPVSIKIHGIARNAEISVPPNINNDLLPVVFVFHGHGGSINSAALRFHIELYWHEAIVVYPQGLDTPSDLVDPEGKFSGWQSSVDDQGGRDIEFFDGLLQYLDNKYPVDKTRIYSIGFSNGAVFTYVLWAARGEVLAAVAPIAGVLPKKEDRDKLGPKPVFIVAGRNDQLVKYSWQMEMARILLKINKCETRRIVNTNLSEYGSTIAAPIETYINGSGHEIPEEALPYIVEFFKKTKLNYKE